MATCALHALHHNCKAGKTFAPLRTSLICTCDGPAGKGSAATLAALQQPPKDGNRNLHYLGRSGVVSSWCTCVDHAMLMWQWLGGEVTLVILLLCIIHRCGRAGVLSSGMPQHTYLD